MESIKKKIYKYRLVLLVCFIIIAAVGIFFIGKTVVDSEMKKIKDDQIVNGISNLHYNKIFDKIDEDSKTKNDKKKNVSKTKGNEKEKAEKAKAEKVEKIEKTDKAEKEKK